MGAFTINRDYDAASNLTELKTTGDSTVGYSYNMVNNLAAIDIPGGESDGISFVYDKARKRTSTTMPGNISNISYDQASRVTTMTNETSAGVQSFRYDYDANGNITSLHKISRSPEPQAWGAAISDTRYNYDKLNRLVGWYDSAKDSTTTYSYDKVGNLLEVKDGQTITKSFAYNAANQISSPGYLYDDNGNMQEDISKRYLYDSENRLAEVMDKSTNATIAAYSYDFMGRRISSTDSSGSTTYFHYDGWNVVAESDNNGQITANYYYDQSGQIQAMKKAGQTYYYQFNAHGDVVSLTYSSGSLVNEYQYDPWGNHLITSETISNPYRYAGYRWDSDTGLYYLRARYYEPGIGRFISKDLFTGYSENPGSFNLYIYARNNPLRYIDPKGNSPVDFAISDLEDELDELEKEHDDEQLKWEGHDLGYGIDSLPNLEFWLIGLVYPPFSEERTRIKVKWETDHINFGKYYARRKKQLEEAILQLKIIRLREPKIARDEIV